MAELVLPAKLDNLDDALAFVESQLEQMECPLKVIMQINVAFEEMFVNVAHYAYPDKEGEAVIKVEPENNGAVIMLEDSGIPFNPLMREDPDVSLSADERKIGGLGIFMTKKMMDKLEYEYNDGKNILKMVKNFA